MRLRVATPSSQAFRLKQSMAAGGWCSNRRMLSVCSASRRVSVRDGSRLTPAHLISADAFRSIFNFSVFNRVQSDTFDVAFPPDKQPKDNMVVSAPTGAGKTVGQVAGLAFSASVSR